MLNELSSAFYIKESNCILVMTRITCLRNRLLRELGSGDSWPIVASTDGSEIEVLPSIFKTQRIYKSRIGNFYYHKLRKRLNSMNNVP